MSSRAHFTLQVGRVWAGRRGSESPRRSGFPKPYGGGGEPESRFPHNGLFHHRAFTGLTGTRREVAWATNTATATYRRMAPRNAQMLSPASTSATGNVTNPAQTPKTPARNLCFVAKYVRHDVQCAGRILEAKKRPRKGMVFSPQLGHRYSLSVCAPFPPPRRSGLPRCLGQPTTSRRMRRSDLTAERPVREASEPPRANALAPTPETRVGPGMLPQEIESTLCGAWESLHREMDRQFLTLIPRTSACIHRVAQPRNHRLRDSNCRAPVFPSL